jgi:hypothetical protein
VCIAVVNENVSLVVSRIVLTEVANALTRLNDQVSKEVAHYALDKVPIDAIYSQLISDLKLNLLLIETMLAGATSSDLLRRTSGRDSQAFVADL